ncbi:hypothetical protein LBBP_02703 [Leptospira borgpetersenii serovar Ballum]|uniref:Uncharacterized protein n=4 Tax=Leptospira borgpetersenii TaxID=174 RepID=A0A0S2ITD8_LEPBO|nr:hypothetical protein LBBP_02703 [Leptospira borgpetersenii serovar Ballum]
MIKKNAKKYLLLRMGAPYQSPSQNCLLWERHCRDTVLSPLNVGVPTDHGSLNIYGLSNRFYCSCTLIGVLTIPRFWDKSKLKFSMHKKEIKILENLSIIYF